MCFMVSMASTAPLPRHTYSTGKQVPLGNVYCIIRAEMKESIASRNRASKQNAITIFKYILAFVRVVRMCNRQPSHRPRVLLLTVPQICRFDVAHVGECVDKKRYGIDHTPEKSQVSHHQFTYLDSRLDYWP